MGLLDDAIREHLDLKRRRGADPSEIAREEQEALGPPRRSAEPLAAPAPVRARRVEPDDGIGDTEDARWEDDGAAEDAPTAFGRPLTQDPAIGAHGGGLSPIEVRHFDDGENDPADAREEPAGLEAIEPPAPESPPERPVPLPEPEAEIEWHAPAEPQPEWAAQEPDPEPEWQFRAEPQPEWPTPPPEPEPESELEWQAPTEPEPEGSTPPPESAPVVLDDSALVEEDDELDLDEFAGGDTDEFVFEDEDFFADELEDPAPAAHEPPFEPFAGPPAPSPEPPAPDPFVAREPETPAPPEGDQPTRQYSVADIEEAMRHRPAAEPEEDQETPEGEDLLEETPEFLEETPEHDRLWFEQKPPRDFDF